MLTAHTLGAVQSLRSRLRSFTWLALFAMLGLALAPTVSHALATVGVAGGSKPWAEICSAAGAKLSSAAVLPDTPESPESPAAPSDGTAMHPEHCPLCTLASHTSALPPADPALLPVPDGAAYLPALFSHAPRPLFAWASARPRGPPAIS